MSAPASPRERRRSYRVDDSVALHYRVLDAQGAARVRAELEAGEAGPEPLGAELALTAWHVERGLAGIEEAQPQVAECLRLLNRRLDALAAAVARADPELGALPRRDVELSADGVRFASREPIPPGTPLELRLLLLPAPAALRALGRVVRASTCGGGDTTLPHHVAVDLEVLRGSDRELLARHVRQREAELLRARRADRDPRA
jgi:hypothetical protein